MQDLWTLKYRARTLDEMLGNKHAISTLSDLAQSGILPHLILYGPENSGKLLLRLPLPERSMAKPGRIILHILMLLIFLIRENAILSGINALCIF